MNTQQQMLEDIRVDAELTAEMTGRDRFSSTTMKAMATVPRDQFVPTKLLPQANYNIPLPIGHGQTISQPYIVALMTDLLDAQPEYICLEVGTGSGYQAAVLAQLVQQVYSVEIVPALHLEAKARLKRLHFNNIDCILGGESVGFKEHAPYDGILVTAAADQIPEALIDQLASGGRMVIPVGPQHLGQTLYLVEKNKDGKVIKQPLLAVRFVPLLSAKESFWKDNF